MGHDVTQQDVGLDSRPRERRTREGVEAQPQEAAALSSHSGALAAAGAVATGQRAIPTAMVEHPAEQQPAEALPHVGDAGMLDKSGTSDSTISSSVNGHSAEQRIAGGVSDIAQTKVNTQEYDGAVAKTEAGASDVPEEAHTKKLGRLLCEREPHEGVEMTPAADAVLCRPSDADVAPLSSSISTEPTSSAKVSSRGFITCF